MANNINFNEKQILKVKNLLTYIYSLAELEEETVYDTLRTHKTDILSKSYCRLDWQTIKELVSIIGNKSTEDALEDFNELVTRNTPKTRNEINKKLKELGYEFNFDMLLQNANTFAGAEYRADKKWQNRKTIIGVNFPVSAIDEYAVIRLKDMVYFKSVAMAEKKLKVTGIEDCCKAFLIDGETGHRDSAGNVWMYLKDYYNMFVRDKLTEREKSRYEL